MNILPKFTAAIALFGLAACSGGSGSSTPPPAQTAPVTSKSSTADLIAFAADGGTSRVLNYGNYAGAKPSQITRTTKTITVNGKPITVFTDATSQGVVGIAQLREDGVNSYRVNRSAPVVTDAPDGSYVGIAQGTFRHDSGSEVIQGDGQFGATLDSTRGVAAYHLSVFSHDRTKGVNMQGDAVYKDGRFVDAKDAHLRVDGVHTRSENVSLSGAVIGSKDVSALAGEFSGKNNDTGFFIDGVFMAGSSFE